MDIKRRISILLVQDSSDDVNLFRRMLDEAGISTDFRWVDTLTTALERLAAEAFDIVVTDLGLPGTQGIETFLRLHSEYPLIPIIVLTRISDEDLACEAVGKGAQDYLVKGHLSGDLLKRSIRYSIERQKLLTALQSKLSELSKMAIEREKILSMFAHDIKNAVMFSALILGGILSGKSQDLRDDLSAIKDELEQANHLLTNFVEFSRFEAKDYIPEKSFFNIEELIRKQSDIAQATADQENIKISCSLSPTPMPSVRADVRMMRRVIANLLHNAIKYSEVNGIVSIAVTGREADVLVEVKDNGIGMDGKQLPHVFDAFYSADASSKGFGLGLCIAKRIVEAHDGEIWVESTPRVGSTFSFTLPL